VAEKLGLLEAIRLRRSGPSSDAHLDDLFDPIDEEPTPAEPPLHRNRPWAIISVLQTFVASAVLYTGFHVFDLAPPYLLLLAVSAGVVLVRQATVATREARPRTRDLVVMRWEQFGGPLTPVEDDGLLDTIGRWSRRLEWGATNPDRFGRTVIVRIGEMADERLRQRHALTRASDPTKARELLGEELWELLSQRGERVPAPGRMTAALRRLEAV
jgi:hypothetical protein